MHMIISTHENMNVCFQFSGGDCRDLKEKDVQANNNAKYQELWPIMRKDLLWTESKDVW